MSDFLHLDHLREKIQKIDADIDDLGTIGECEFLLDAIGNILEARQETYVDNFDDLMDALEEWAR